MSDKPVHELKAFDFDLDKRNPMETFPTDGRIVAVECSDQVWRLAVWSAIERAIVFEQPLPGGVRPLRWQEK